MFGLHFTSPENGFACGAGIILRTTNGGMQWTDAGYIGLETINDVEPYSAGVFAVGSNGTLLKLELPESVASGAPSAVRAYPNPARQALFIDVPYQSQVTVTIADVLGRVVRKLSADGPSLRVERSGIESGVYYYLVDDELGRRIASGKFIFE